MNAYTLCRHSLVIFSLLYSINSQALCYKITSYNYDKASVIYTEPGKGTAQYWSGAQDILGTMGSTPKVININNNEFQPLGTLIGSGTVSFMDAGSIRYQPDQILYRCTADEESKLREFYSTNGDSTYAGMYQVNSALGLDETYTTIVYGMGMRVKNSVTGEYYSRYWKSRPLTNLDHDSQGWILVKAKDFSNAEIELFKINYNSDNLGNPGVNSGTGLIMATQPAAYIALKSSNLSTNFDDGVDHYGHYDGFADYWPAAMVNVYNNLIIRRSATCFVKNVTPYVSFKVISVGELKSNQKLTVPINIDFSCQTDAPANNNVVAMTSGTDNNQTAMGFLPRAENIITAQKEGLTVNNGTAVTHLLSDGYGVDPNIAKGVGVRIYRQDGTALNFLSSLVSEGKGASYGWYPVLDDAMTTSNSNGIITYSKTLNASFESLPGKAVTPGKYNATVQVIIQVQ